MPDLPDPNSAPPLYCREAHEWLGDRLAKEAHVEPTPADHPAYDHLVKAARDGIAAFKVTNPGTNLPHDVQWLRYSAALEHVVRRCGLGREAALALLVPLSHHRDPVRVSDDIATIRARGVSRPGALRDEILAEYDAEQAIYVRERAAAEEAERRRKEKVTYDLATEGLCVVTSDEPLPFEHRRGDTRRTSYAFSTYGLPADDDLPIAIPYLNREGGLAVIQCRIRSAGPIEMTRAEREEANAALPEILVERMREVRQRGGPWAKGVLPADPDAAKTVEGRHALHLMRARCAELVHALANAPRGPRSQ